MTQSTLRFPSELLSEVHNERHYKAWERFHTEHPEVYQKLVELTSEVKGRGFNHFGIRMIWERMRWFFKFERGNDDYKLNDHYPPYYARYIMERNPDLAGFFETRERHG